MVQRRLVWKERKENPSGKSYVETFNDLLKSDLISIFEEETDQAVHSWTEDNVFLPDGEGAFSASNPDWSMAPEMEYIFSLLKNPEVKEIYLMFSSQSSKTLFEICAMSWLITVRKINGLFVPPDERLITRLRERMENIWEKSPIIPFQSKKGGKEFSKFGTNRLAWGLASSPSSLAEMPADFVVFDEIDEIKPQDVNPIQLSRSRGRTKPNFKLILGSTPKLLEGKEGILDYYNNSKRHIIEMKCPHCEEYSEFTEKEIMAPEEADYKQIESEGLGFAVCPKNGCVIEDEAHEEMVNTQKWRDLDPDQPITYVGFHKPVWCTKFEDWSSVAAERLKTKAEGPNSEKDFNNSWCAQPIDMDVLGGEAEQGDIALEKYKRKQVPDDVKSITVGVDVGVYTAHCTVIGWATNKKTYQLYEQVIDWDSTAEGFDKIERGIGHLLNDISTEFYYLGTGLKPQFVGGAIDAGYRSDLVYDFCRRNPMWVPVMGKEPLAGPWTITNADPKKNYGAKARGVKLYTIKSYYWQAVLQTAIERPADMPGSFNIPIDYTKRYLDHINGEVKKLKIDERTGQQKEFWEKKSRSSKVDFRDATIYAKVRGYILDLDKLTDLNDSPIITKERETLNSFNSLNGRRRLNTSRKR